MSAGARSPPAPPNEPGCSSSEQPPTQQQHAPQRRAHGSGAPAVTFTRALPAHAGACLKIQHATYPAELWEERAVVESILAHGCSFLALQGGAPVGYLLTHAVPDPLAPPPLNHPLPPPPAGGTGRGAALAPPHLFIHDLCLLPTLHGGGVGSRLAAHALAALAPRAASLSCVALPGAVGFWRRHGFHPPAAGRPPPAAKAALASYPGGSQLLLLRQHSSGGGGGT